MYRPRKKFQFKQRFFLINFHKILFFTSYKKKKKFDRISRIDQNKKNIRYKKN